MLLALVSNGALLTPEQPDATLVEAPMEVVTG
jgi:hypothetical protein